LPKTPPDPTQSTFYRLTNWTEGVQGFLDNVCYDPGSFLEASDALSAGALAYAGAAGTTATAGGYAFLAAGTFCTGYTGGQALMSLFQ
jgi:hypothetical protein